MHMQNSVAKKSFQQNSMSKFEMVPWNPLSSHLNRVLFQHVANVGRVKNKEGTHLLESFYMLPTKEDVKDGCWVGKTVSVTAGTWPCKTSEDCIPWGAPNLQGIKI